MSVRSEIKATETQLRALDAQKHKAAELREKLRTGLPHLYGWKWYHWSKMFFESRNRMKLLCAANQITKSSTQIRQCIEWAGNKSLWGELWKREPRVFWYLYPDKPTATAEFDNKWVPDFLPRNEFIDHPTYGWRIIRGEKRQVDYIEFKSGVRVYFKTYAQDVKNLQSGTVHAIFCDEELPEELYSELMARLFDTDGFFSMVFTATLNQDFWRLAIEGEGEMEKFPDAFKQQISMRDCITFNDGSPGAYNEEKIRRIEATCKNEQERKRRVDGKFITVSGGRTGRK